MGIYGNDETSVKNSKVLYGHAWKCIEMNWNSRRCMKMYGHVWKCIELYGGNIWDCMKM